MKICVLLLNLIYKYADVLAVFQNWRLFSRNLRFTPDMVNLPTCGKTYVFLKVTMLLNHNAEEGKVSVFLLSLAAIHSNFSIFDYPVKFLKLTPKNSQEKFFFTKISLVISDETFCRLDIMLLYQFTSFFFSVAKFENQYLSFNTMFYAIVLNSF